MRRLVGIAASRRAASQIARAASLASVVALRRRASPRANLRQSGETSADSRRRITLACMRLRSRSAIGADEVSSTGSASGIRVAGAAAGPARAAPGEPGCALVKITRQLFDHRDHRRIDLLAMGVGPLADHPGAVEATRRVDTD